MRNRSRSILKTYYYMALKTILLNPQTLKTAKLKQNSIRKPLFVKKSCLFLCLCLSLVSPVAAQEPSPTPEPSTAAAPILPPMPVKTSLLKLRGLPSQCGVLTISLSNKDPLQPGYTRMSRAVARFKGSSKQADYGIDLLLGPGIWPHRYAAGEILLSCENQALSQSWNNSQPLFFDQTELSLDLTNDFKPLASTIALKTPAGVSDLLKRAEICRQAANPRFFESLGDNYPLNFNGGTPVEIIGRKTWKADPPLPIGRSWQPFPAEASVCSWYQKITVHHTHTALSITALQKYHQTQADPKADIAYHFYIPEDGKIYEARPLGYMGSHSEGDNGNNLGIVLNGDFRQKRPDIRQIQALRSLLTALRCPCGFVEGLWTHQQRKALHFHGDPQHSTECPGQELALEVYGLAAELGYGPITKVPNSN
jgi:hypothetical protein